MIGAYGELSKNCFTMPALGIWQSDYLAHYVFQTQTRL